MLDGCSKTLDGTTANVPQNWNEQLEALLSRINGLPEGTVRAGLVGDMVSYVLTGAPQAVLQEVGQNSNVAEQLNVVGYSDEREHAVVLRFYDAFDTLPVEVALRWARLLEACVVWNNSRLFLKLPGEAHWPEVLLMHTTGHGLNVWSPRRPHSAALSAPTIEKLLIEAGIAPAALLVASFSEASLVGYYAYQRHLLITDLKDYGMWLDREVESIRHLLDGSVAHRLHCLSMLERAEVSTLRSLLPELMAMVASSSKQVRSAADVVIRRVGLPACAALLDFACRGKPEQRLHALRLMYTIACEQEDAPSQQLARDTAAADKAASVNALLAEWDDEQQSAAKASTQTFDYAMPVIKWPVALTPVLSDQLDALWQTITDSMVTANKQSIQHHQRMQAAGHNFPLRQITLYTEDDQRALRAYLASESPMPPEHDDRRMINHHHVGPALRTLVASEEMTPAALLKMLLFFDLATDSDGKLSSVASGAFNEMYRTSGRPTLLELSGMLEEAGQSATSVLYTYCSAWGDPIGREWDHGAVWPFVARHLETVVQLLAGRDEPFGYWFNRDGLFRAIATLPFPPPPLVNVLFSLALGTAKTQRQAAQVALATLPDKEARIVSALADGKADTRAVAAQWLGRLGFTGAVAALELALKKEKNDLAKGAMLDALEVLGQPVDKYLDRTALLGDATKALGKGLPKELAWFPWAALPTVRWANNGEAVDGDLLRWMMVQAVKQKQSEPNTLLRKLCAMFEQRDRERLGQFILEAWLDEDVRPIAPEDAMALAQGQAHSMHHYLSNYSKGPNAPQQVPTLEELVAKYLPACLRQPAGSASASRGLLAISAVCAREGAAVPVSRYLKAWYGSRASQGKALIGMLAWIDHPSATQLMLSIGSRFRTKSFQDEATSQASALAERKGWTLSELADRTIPTAGFDENGEMELNYGPRSFAAHLHADFRIELCNQDGKKIAALPEPRQDDDAELAKDARKALSAAKKEIKSIVSLQSERLYEALCTEREWSFEDWSLYLNRHPVVRHLAQRLVWVEVGKEGALRTFRPLDDGTLTDVDDEELQFRANARIRIAHDCLLTPDQIARWQQHLSDYEIVPLFQQMGKGIYIPPAEVRNNQCITDFEGHLIESFALRGRSLKLGYLRGATEDGGWFYSYEKRFPTLGLQAVITFTGNPLPEENRTVALLNLSFSSTASRSGWQRAGLPLHTVPKILLSECYNDLRVIASEGSGFDPEWKKKSEY